jgi:hypothetical protein
MVYKPQHHLGWVLEKMAGFGARFAATGMLAVLLLAVSDTLPLFLGINSFRLSLSCHLPYSLELARRLRLVEHVLDVGGYAISENTCHFLQNRISAQQPNYLGVMHTSGM